MNSLRHILAGLGIVQIDRFVYTLTTQVYGWKPENAEAFVVLVVTIGLVTAYLVEEFHSYIIS